MKVTIYRFVSFSELNEFSWIYKIGHTVVFSSSSPGYPEPDVTLGRNFTLTRLVKDVYVGVFPDDSVPGKCWTIPQR